MLILISPFFFLRLRKLEFFRQVPRQEEQTTTLQQVDVDENRIPSCAEYIDGALVQASFGPARSRRASCTLWWAAQ